MWLWMGEGWHNRLTLYDRPIHTKDFPSKLLQPWLVFLKPYIVWMFLLSTVHPHFWKQPYYQSFICRAFHIFQTSVISIRLFNLVVLDVQCWKSKPQCHSKRILILCDQVWRNYPLHPRIQAPLVSAKSFKISLDSHKNEIIYFWKIQIKRKLSYNHNYS